MDDPLDAGGFPMTGGSVGYYPFPDDGNQTLHRVISTLPRQHAQAITWRPSTDWLLEVSPSLARALTGMFQDAGVYQPDPVGMPDRVLVPDAIRSSVERVLDVIRSPGTWFQIEGVEFWNQEAKRAFEALI
jgi:hypothetical protein